MEVRPGYKQSEVGILPIDWSLKRLGELSTVSAGGTPNRMIANYWNGDIPWITTSEIDSRKIEQAQQFLTREGLNNSAAKLLPPGTLLMALYGQGKTSRLLKKPSPGLSNTPHAPDHLVIPHPLRGEKCVG